MKIINILNHQNSSKIQSECTLLNDVFHNRRLGLFTSTKLRAFLMAMQRVSFVLKTVLNTSKSYATSTCILSKTCTKAMS